MAEPALHRTPSTFKLQHASPLDALAGRSRETRDPAAAYHSPASWSQSSPDPHVIPSRPLRPPGSPLLHTQFRSSTATASSSGDTSYYYSRSEASFDSQDAEYYRHGDDESVYSTQNTHWLQSHDSNGHHDPTGYSRESWQSSYTNDTAHRSVTPTGSSSRRPVDTDLADRNDSPVPIVVVSDHDTYIEPQAQTQTGAKKAPILTPTIANFSRPGRPPVMSSEEQKRQVLERNSVRHATSSPHLSPKYPSPAGVPSDVSALSDHPSGRSQESSPSSRSQSRSRSTGRSSPSYPPPSSPLASTSTSMRRSPSPSYFPPYPPTFSTSAQAGVSSPPYPSQPPSAMSASTSRSSRSPSPSPVPDYLRNSYLQASPTLFPSTAQSPASTIPTENIALSGRPPSLRVSPTTSVYSSYSFYQLDSPALSPVGSGTRSPHAAQGGNRQHLSPPGSTPSSRPSSPASSVSQHSPQEYLQLGIQHHEANRLQDSAACFEKSATADGGCGMGMLMWGLTLRHGWGCAKDEKSGFKWLRKAAELATEDLESTREDEASAVQTELVIAIYEVAQCFFQGWGVPKDQKMAVSYYTVAARLGDMDAQQDLAFCLANGKGCKKDRKEAAKWYREAVAQGASDVGMAWIYKEKFS